MKSVKLPKSAHKKYSSFEISKYLNMNDPNVLKEIEKSSLISGIINNINDNEKDLNPDKVISKRCNDDITFENLGVGNSVEDTAPDIENSEDLTFAQKNKRLQIKINRAVSNYKDSKHARVEETKKDHEDHFSFTRPRLQSATTKLLTKQVTNDYEPDDNNNTESDRKIFKIKQSYENFINKHKGKNKSRQKNIDKTAVTGKSISDEHIQHNQDITKLLMKKRKRVMSNHNKDYYTNTIVIQTEVNKITIEGELVKAIKEGTDGNHGFGSCYKRPVQVVKKPNPTEKFFLKKINDEDGFMKTLRSKNRCNVEKIKRIDTEETKQLRKTELSENYVSLRDDLMHNQLLSDLLLQKLEEARRQKDKRWLLSQQDEEYQLY